MACDAAVFEIKARQGRKYKKQPYHSFLISCVYRENESAQIDIHFPFPSLDRHYISLGRITVQAIGTLCPFKAGVVQEYPSPLVVGGFFFAGGLGVVVNNIFIGVKRCPRSTQFMSPNSPAATP